MLKNFPNQKKAVINDINEDLINTYKTIASNPKELISILQILQNEFHGLEGQEEAKKNITTQKESFTTKEKKNKADKPLCLFFLIGLVLTGFIE